MIFQNLRKNVMQAYIKYKAFDDRRVFASKLKNEIFCMSYSLKEIIKEMKFLSQSFSGLGPAFLKMLCPTTITWYAKSEQRKRKCFTVSDYAKSHLDNSYLTYKPSHENGKQTLRSISNMTIFTPAHGSVSLNSLFLTATKIDLTYLNHQNRSTIRPSK